MLNIIVFLIKHILKINHHISKLFYPLPTQTNLYLTQIILIFFISPALEIEIIDINIL